MLASVMSIKVIIVLHHKLIYIDICFIIQVETEQEERDALHERVQGMIRRYCAGSKLTRKKHMHREATLARLEMDSSLMLSTLGFYILIYTGCLFDSSVCVCDTSF